MNNVFAAKLLQNLNNKKGEKGFTLIELLVVVIIIGVLAAVALPNLLGQVGKARESEAKTALGALNRSQQAYRLESATFFNPTASVAADAWTETENALGVVPGRDFYTFATTSGDATSTTFTANGDDPDNSGVRDFASGASYNSGRFDSILCIATAKDTSAAASTVGSAAAYDTSTSAMTCSTGNSIG